MADLKISQLPVLPGSSLQAGDQLAVVDISASETKNITSKELVQAAIQLIDAGSIPGDKVTVTLPAGIVVTATLADGSVTAAKLANSSTAVIGASLPPVGAYVGQLGILTGNHKASVWDGAAWQPFERGILSIAGGVVGSVSTVVTTAGDNASVLAQVVDSTVAAEFLAGPTASGGQVKLRRIVPADLPLATSSTQGIAAVPTGQGLKIDGGVSGLGADLVIDNDVTASSSNYLVTYDAKGLVTGGRAIVAADLPLSSNSSVGAIIAGPEFAVAPGGVLQHSNNVTAATFAKITYDSHGHVTSGTDLAAADIPDLPAGKITTGEFPTVLYADKSVTAPKIADYAISYIQEANPGTLGAFHIGMLWYQESTAGLHMWNGNSWMPISIGRLSQENLRYCGIIDATTGLIAGVTSFGTAAGYKIGDSLKASNDAHTGVYFVITTPGNAISETPSVAYDNGDWVLCNGAVAGWVRVDTLNGGGGGGAKSLPDLLDVTLTTPAADQLLQYNSAGQWVNIDTIDCGTY